MGALFEKIKLLPGKIYDRAIYGPGPGRDPEILAGGIEPPTARERAGMAAISDVDLEIFLHKMTSIVEEARDVYMSLSISEGIITADMNCSVFTASGDPAVVATGIYFHSLLNYAQVKYILKYYRDDPTVGLKDGDVYFFNDPTCGGVHTFDMFVTAPIFFEGELIAWAEVGGHQGECGSITPGGFSPKATTRYEEGLHVHALRIGEHWQIRTDILDFFCNSVRNPFVFASDLKARTATCLRIRDRVLREVERRGVAFVTGGLRKIMAKTGELARARLRKVNDGIYRSVLFNDTVGTEQGLVRIPVTAIKEGDQLTVLVQGVSPINGKGPMHATWHLTRASLGVYLFSYFFRGLPPNIGLFEPIRVLVEGPSVANADEEVAHGEGTSISAAVVQNLHVIGSKMLFDSPYRESVSAPHARNVQVYVFGGINRFGYRTMNFTGAVNAAGQGARFDGDGEHAMGFFWGPFTDAGETEEMDERLPPFILSRGIDRDYHGYGKYRGGSPMVEVTMAYGKHSCVMSSWGSADKITHNPGIFGGYWGPPNPRFVIRDTDVLERLRAGALGLRFTQYDLARDKPLQGRYIFQPSSVATEEFKQGDVFVNQIGAGGGYGDVLERDPALVMADLKAGFLTHEVARAIYRVAYDEQTLEVDSTKTEALRQAEREARKRRGQRFDAFIAQWSAKRPRAELLKYYGHWPEPSVPDYEKPFWGLYE